MADDDDKDKVIAELRKEEAGLRRKLRDTEARAAQLEAAEGDRDKIIAQAKAEGASEERVKLNAEHSKALAGAEVRAAAAKRLADPDDAVRFLDMDQLLGADGKVDAAKIDAELVALVEKKPYLAAAGAGGGGGGDDGGANGTGGKPTGSGDGGPRPPAAGSSDDQVNALLRQAAGRK